MKKNLCTAVAKEVQARLNAGDRIESIDQALKGSYSAGTVERSLAGAGIHEKNCLSPNVSLLMRHKKNAQ